jgi:hypothetical protein
LWPGRRLVIKSVAVKTRVHGPRRKFSTVGALLTIAIGGVICYAAWHVVLRSELTSDQGSANSSTGGVSHPPATAEKSPCGSYAVVWTDQDGRKRPVAELKEIETQHILWISSKGQQGEKADFSAADLHCVDLRGRSLEYADLTGANLARVDLTGADLRAAEGATDQSCGLDQKCATDLTEAKLNGAKLQGADLTGARLVGADFTAAFFDKDSDLSRTDLKQAIFQPKEPPITENAYTAYNLRLLTYHDDPKQLTLLRKGFEKDGRDNQERQIVYALQYTNASKKWEQCLSGRDDAQPPSQLHFGVLVSDCVGASLDKLVFDLPFQYGMNPSRPLYVIGALWLFCSILYVVIIKTGRRSAIFLVCQRYYRDGRTIVRRARIVPRPVNAAGVLERLAQIVWREIGIWRVALFFSLESALNIGFQELQLGRWLRLLTTREYDLKGTGWARSLSGAQSLLSLLMLALSIWGLFGQPFAS